MSAGTSTSVSPAEMEARVGRLVEWLKASGATGLDSVAIQSTTATATATANTEDTNHNRGVHATKDVNEGDTVLQIPWSVAWTEQAALDDPVLGPVLRGAEPPVRPDDAIALHLIYERAKGEASERAAHVAVLPAEYPFHPINWTPGELDELRASPARVLTERQSVEIIEDYAALCKVAAEAPEGTFPDGALSLESYKWALCTIWSRAMDVLVSGSVVRCLVPYADMFNHSTDKEVSGHDYSADADALTVVAGRNYAAGEEITITYGALSSARSLRLYGFAFLMNPHDSLEIYAPIDPRIDENGEKTAALAAMGIDCNQPFLIQSDFRNCVPQQLLTALRVQRMDSLMVGELATQAGQGPVNVENEKVVLDSLKEAFEAMLGAYGDEAVNYESGLLKGGQAAEFNTNYRHALCVRSNEKVLLHLARSYVTRLRDKLE